MFGISSGKSLLPLKELFAIIKYFEITPHEFFREQNHYPDLINKVIEGICELSEYDIKSLLGVIGQLCLMRGIIRDLSSKEEDCRDFSVHSLPPC
jgi:hypothetical protein